MMQDTLLIVDHVWQQWAAGRKDRVLVCVAHSPEMVEDILAQYEGKRTFDAIAFAPGSGLDSGIRCYFGGRSITYQVLFERSIALSDNIHFCASFSALRLRYIMRNEDLGGRRLKYISGYRSNISTQRFQLDYINRGCPGKRKPKQAAKNFICYNRGQLH